MYFNLNNIYIYVNVPSAVTIARNLIVGDNIDLEIVDKNNRFLFVSITNTSSLKSSSMANLLLLSCDVLTISAHCLNKNIM
jgi:hypothetical protein